MNRMFATALFALSTTAGAAFAQDATEAEMVKIQSYAPGADVSELSAAEVDQLIAVINSGSSEGDKRNYVQNFFD